MHGKSTALCVHFSYLHTDVISSLKTFQMQNTGCKCLVSNSWLDFRWQIVFFLGLKSLKPQYTPKLSKEFSQYSWKLICCAPHHTIALDDNGKTYAIGRKEYGRLGLGKESEDATELTEIAALKNKMVVNIACGSATSFAVTDKGKLILIFYNYKCVSSVRRNSWD